MQGWNLYNLEPGRRNELRERKELGSLSSLESESCIQRGELAKKDRRRRKCRFGRQESSGGSGTTQSSLSSVGTDLFQEAPVGDHMKGKESTGELEAGVEEKYLCWV